MSHQRPSSRRSGSVVETCALPMFAFATCRRETSLLTTHPGGNPGANLKSISHRCYLILVAFVWKLTKETIELPLGCLLGGYWSESTLSSR